jgi:hypothetical protein
VVVTDGVTLNDAPVASTVAQEELEPQVPEYHFQAPAVPVFPLTERITELPLQTAFPTALLLTVTGPHGITTLIITDEQEVVLQDPSARTKYVVLDPGVTLML